MYNENCLKQLSLLMGKSREVNEGTKGLNKGGVVMVMSKSEKKGIERKRQKRNNISLITLFFLHFVIPVFTLSSSRRTRTYIYLIRRSTDFHHDLLISFSQLTRQLYLHHFIQFCILFFSLYKTTCIHIRNEGNTSLKIFKAFLFIIYQEN